MSDLQCIHCRGPVEVVFTYCPPCEEQHKELSQAREELCRVAVRLVREGLQHGEALVRAANRFGAAENAYLHSVGNRRPAVVAPEAGEA